MEKLNIAELLKDCPKGMELYSPLCGDCKLYDVNDYGIRIKDTNKNTLINLYHDGRYCIKGEIMIFPKGKTTWEGFVPPYKFEDGDVVAVTMIPEGIWIGIFKQYNEPSFESHCCLSTIGEFRSKGFKNHSLIGIRFATEEEKKKLFNAIKDNGYKWNEETKTLEKLPRFKMWDKIRHKNDKTTINTICCIYDDSYRLSDGHLLFFKEQDQYELAPNKFDINTLIPFESKVLVRSSMDGLWKPAVFGFRNGYNDNAFYIVGGSCWKQCIPYLNNEHLCGTTNDCDEFYKTWK